MKRKILLTLACLFVAACAVTTYFLAFAGPSCEVPSHLDVDFGLVNRQVLFPELASFVRRRVKPDLDFVTLNMLPDKAPAFAKVPRGWFTRGTPEEGKSREIVLDENGFRILIRIKTGVDVEKALKDHIPNGYRFSSIVLLDHLFDQKGGDVVRCVTCYEFKSFPHVKECRYYGPAMCVELTVLDSPPVGKTVADLLGHLRRHYGKYEGICDQVASLLVETEK